MDHRNRALLIACAGILVGLTVWSRAQASAPQTTNTTPQPTSAALGAQDATPERHAWRIVARKYSFNPQRIEVQQDDLVKITLETDDIPHSFIIDEPYRIAKRTTAGHTTVFEFRADKVGAFPFYCNLTADDGCRKMRGELVVKAKK
ncbi:MAG TPA: cupredoxin domain-containing protein [Vicinamibacterales bacterium]|jgi:heme/copper-type cytochrome/quinol oxidase subunit 2